MESTAQSTNRTPPLIARDDPPVPTWRRMIRLARDTGVWADLWNEWRLRSFTTYATPEAISFPPDTNKLSHSSIRWPARSPWEGFPLFCPDVRVGLERFVRVKIADIPQPYPGVVLFQLQIKDRAFDVAVDFRDYPDVIQEEALRRAAMYFKMQFRREGYASMGYGPEKLVPGGYVTSSPSTYCYIPSLRPLADRSAKAFDVYGRFGLRYARETREKAISILRTQTQFKYHGGAGRVRYSRTLTEMCQSRVCIDLPGNGDFCMRLVDYFSIGACIVGPRHGTVFHVPLEDGKHLAYCKDDMSDLVSLCEYYLENDKARENLAQNSRLYFDRFLHRDQLAAYYLQQTLKVVG